MGYRIETIMFEELEGKLKLPTFQRALVWSNMKATTSLEC